MSSSAHIVDPSKIQQELNKIWNEIDKTNKLQASLFNLIIYTKKNKRTDYIYSIVQKVIEKFPLRVFFICEDGEEEIKTAVSVMNASSGEFLIACDLIEILCSEKNEHKVPFILLPHLIPDLPIYLLWGDDPSIGSPLFTELQKYAERIIFDSESATDLKKFAKTVLSLKTEVADLNWARVEALREVISTAYKRKEFTEVTTGKITYNKIESDFFVHSQVPAIFIQTWLENQLGWKFTLDTEKVDNLPPGMILSIECTTKTEGHFSFQRNRETPHQIAEIYSTNDHCDIPTKYTFPKQQSGQSLIKEIFHKGSSIHYLKVLEKLC